ncbi:hypothetical protein B0H13DRAFT_2342941 [Mycena leptocephala]|nr:hypothetical protein B0H13DRAFT_2342941 [Mycena leptocephala]
MCSSAEFQILGIKGLSCVDLAPHLFLSHHHHLLPTASSPSNNSAALQLLLAAIISPSQGQGSPPGYAAAAPTPVAAAAPAPIPIPVAPAPAPAPAAVPVPAFQTRGPWVAGALYVVVPSGPLTAVAEVELVEGESGPTWYCITKGCWVSVTLNNHLAVSVVQGSPAP